MSKNKFVRKKKLINNALQLKLIGTFVAVACLASLFQVVVFNRSMLSLVHQSPRIGEHLMPRIPGILVDNVLVTLGVLLPVMFAVGVLVTHRVAGPAYAMEKYLRRIAAGGTPSEPCRIRKGDELSSLCDAINAAMAAMSPELEAAEADREELDVDDPPSLGERPSASPAEEDTPRKVS